MKVVGLITEYNPFHNGHLYHITKAKEVTGADYVVAVMSGDFVQRGAPALYTKYTRAAMALNSGADLVLELPSVYAVSSAEDFSMGAISLLDRLGIIDFVCFGSECGDVKPLSAIAGILRQQPKEYTMKLKEGLKSGLTFPEARNKALEPHLTHISDFHSIINSPNNILGIEYLKALDARDSSITPITITRSGSGYHDTTLTEEFGSASAIRQILLSTSETEKLRIQTQVPEFVMNAVRTCTPIWPDDLSMICNYRLLSLLHLGERLSGYVDVSEDLEDRIRHMTLEFSTFSQRIDQLKTRQLTYTRVSRALLHLVLGMKDCDLSACKNEDYISYARVLGFRRSSAPVMKQIKIHGSVPLVTKIINSHKNLSPAGQYSLDQDIYCSHLYQSLVQSKTGIPAKNEYSQPLAIL